MANDDERKKALAAFNRTVTLRKAPDPAELERLRALGRNSSLDPDDLPFGFGDDFIAQTGGDFVRDAQLVLLGSIEDAARKAGKTPQEMLALTRRFLGDPAGYARLWRKDFH